MKRIFFLGGRLGFAGTLALTLHEFSREADEICNEPPI